MVYAGVIGCCFLSTVFVFWLSTRIMKPSVVGKIWRTPCGKPSSAGSRVWSSFARMSSGKNLNCMHVSASFCCSSAFRTMATIVPCVPFATVPFLLTVRVNLDAITCSARLLPRILVPHVAPSKVEAAERGVTRVYGELVSYLDCSSFPQVVEYTLTHGSR